MSEKPKFYDIDRMVLFAPVENNQRASMVFGIRENYPRITVFTRTASDANGKGAISAPFDIESFLIFLRQLEAVARFNGETKEKITCKHFPRDETGKITGDRKVSTEVWLGKNESGVVWLSVLKENRPEIQFQILMSDFHELINSKGQPVSAGEGSVARTLAMIKVLQHWMIQGAVTLRDTSIPRPQKGAYSTRGYSSDAKETAQTYDEDVPF